MTTLQLKNIVVKKISKINDPEFLNAINIIVDSNREQEIFKVNDSIRKKIRKSKSQFLNGEYIDNDEMLNKVDLWLKQR